MKEIKELTLCVVPFMLAAMVLFPFLAIMGGSTDPFVWQREDRVFYFICVTCFGYAMYCRIRYASKEQ